MDWAVRARTPQPQTQDGVHTWEAGTAGCGAEAGEAGRAEGMPLEVPELAAGQLGGVRVRPGVNDSFEELLCIFRIAEL